MSLKAFALEQFGGLNISADPEELGFAGAVDVLNVDFDRRGRVRQRDGLTLRTTLATTGNFPGFMLAYPTRLLVTANGFIHAINSSYAVAATSSQTMSDTTQSNGVVFGTPSATYAYFAAGVTSGTAIIRFDGGSFTTVAGSPTCTYVGVQKPDNRLVAANCSGDFNRVKFSNAGDPATWGANDYVSVSPGDGENISGIATWRDMLFVFKGSKFFVFYGNSTDSTGNPVFNYRAVDNGVGCVGGCQGAVAGKEGVYFLDKTGIYVTTGGPPRKLSGPLDALFNHQPTPLWTVGASSLATPNLSRLAYINGRLYAFLYLTTNSYHVFVYDPETDAWSMWLLGCGMGVGWTNTAVGAVFPTMFLTSFNFSGAAYQILEQRSQATTDNGAAISSFYQSGFGDLGYPGSEKTIRETELVGQGTVGFSWARDFGAQPTASNVTLGTSPAVSRNLHRDAQAGELLSFKVSSVSGGAWQLNRVVPYLRDVRGAAEVTR